MLQRMRNLTCLVALSLVLGQAPPPTPAASVGRPEPQLQVIAALHAATGKAVWEPKYSSPTTDLNFTEGAGPHSTPLLTADRVYATGSRKELFALDKATGKVIWSHDLIKEYRASEPGRGYACSPLLHNDLLIVSMGGPGQALAAFNPKTGALVWKAGAFEFSPASPIVIDVDG
jgi:hypothetical protein